MFREMNLLKARSVGVLVVLLFSLLGSGPAEATVIPVFDKSALFSRADLVLEISVGKSKTLRAGPNGFIHTDHRVVVDRIWHARGAALRVRAGDELSLRQIGGRLGDLEHSVTGTAPIAQGDRLFVFVRYEAGRIFLVGMGQGALLFMNQGKETFVAGMFGARPALRPGDLVGEDLALVRDFVRVLAEKARVGP